MKTFRDLLVWQKSMNLVTRIYQLTQSFPKDESFGLAAQIRRCAVSIPSNLAEGYGRNSKGELHHFAHISAGSLYELQTQLEISLRLGYLNEIEYQTFYEKAREIERMLSSLTRKLQKEPT